MKKLLSLTLLALSVPAAASAASLNMGATLTHVNKGLGIASAPAASRVLAFQAPTPGCPTGGCTNPVPCNNSPENPTALLGVLGAAGLLLGRLGYGRLRNRSTVALSAAA